MTKRRADASEFDGIVVDARGHRCPAPTLRLQRAVREAPAGSTIILLADDPLARIDVPHFAAQAALELMDVREATEWVEFWVRSRGP
ncbi:MAG TPA: sulfurtransferase TusA family protein [Caulobacteraceae bacterium]|jgi:tRNA 2-thiouridine synthesizing protein A|nr:sulfurtransferase TusA family protein [Caulobacteraceae bacterium]